MEIATRNVIFPGSVGLAQAHPLTKPLAMGSKKTSLYITCLVLYNILEDLVLDVLCNAILRCGKERVKSS